MLVNLSNYDFDLPLSALEEIEFDKTKIKTFLLARGYKEVEKFGIMMLSLDYFNVNLESDLEASPYLKRVTLNIIKKDLNMTEIEFLNQCLGVEFNV